MFSANLTLHTTLALPIEPNLYRADLVVPENTINHPSTPSGRKKMSKIGKFFEIIFSEEFFRDKKVHSFPLFSANSCPLGEIKRSPDTPGDSASDPQGFVAMSGPPPGSGDAWWKIGRMHGNI
jgi:hypothetical protein